MFRNKSIDKNINDISFDSPPAKYEKLQKLLAVGKWKTTDQETAGVILKLEKKKVTYQKLKNLLIKRLVILIN